MTIIFISINVWWLTQLLCIRYTILVIFIVLTLRFMAELTVRASVSAPKSIEKEVEVVLNLVTVQSVALRLQNRE